MCGIAGIIGSLANEKTLNKILQRMSHRGEGKYQKENLIFNKLCIGMNRLAIVDEKHGFQPFSYNDQTFCIFNGEIYNHNKLKEELCAYYPFQTECDTEVVLKSYLHWGPDCLGKFDGKFAFCVVDIKNDTLFLARDHVGIKPLYYTAYNDSLFFASELKGFCDLPFIEKIKILLPGSYYLNGIEKKYYSIPEYSISYKSPKVALHEIKVYLIEAVKKRIQPESLKIACLLSGGIDSSIITYIASKYHNNVEAFTINNSDTTSSDLESARVLCNYLGIKHTIVSPTKQELKDFYIKYGVYLTESYEPILVRNAVSYHFVCKKIRDHGYKYALNGEGADELFGGYSFFKEVPETDRDKIIRDSLLNIHQTYLQMADRASMYATLEARVPFMDKEFIRCCMSIPSYFRINKSCEKWALREIFKDKLPHSIITRSKIGMNEGSGFGRNICGEGIYYEAVDEFYKLNKEIKEKDLAQYEQYKAGYDINHNDIEEIYNFARFIDYGYNRYISSNIRLQLNTPLLRK
jgi:asparagine synthase (glutamine-hydrolysing)